MKRFASILIAMAVMLTAGMAGAATLFWDGGTTNIPGNGDGASQGGAGTWNTTTQNWDAGASPHVAWDNTANSNDTVILAGSVGLVTLGEDINLGAMHFSVASTGYTVSNNTLNFSAGGLITATNNTVNQTIKSAINGSPTVRVNRGPSGAGYEGLIFAPSSGTQTLGVIYLPDALGGANDKAGVYLSGSTIGNTAASVTFTNASWQYGTLYKQGSGTWTVGNVNVGTVTITAGDLVSTGTVRTYYNGLQLNGGVFHYNNAGAVYNSLRMNGGSFDNSSGAAITTSTYNPAQIWGGNWTFIGVNGADSDLNLGTNAVTLTGSRSVTVSNALTTLTVGGVIGDGINYYSLTKQGAGTLALTTNNTYKGNTTVAAGTLSLSKACLYDAAAVSVSNGATLNLNYNGTDTVFGIFFDGTLAAVGEWGGPGSAAANKTNLLGGTGILYHNGGLVATNTWLWDGPNYGGIGDGSGAGGAGVWSTSSNNWDQGVVSRKVWNNTTNDVAIFRGAVGTVDLQSDITLGRILIDGASGYVIGSTPETNTLNFGGTNNQIYVNQATTTFRSGITGSPNLIAYCNSGNPVYLYPDSASMTLGDVTVGGVPNNPDFRIGGAATNNTIRRVISANQWSFLFKEGSGTWTVGNIDIGVLTLNAGTLVATGTVSFTYNGLSFGGNNASLILSNGASVVATARIDIFGTGLSSCTMTVVGGTGTSTFNGNGGDFGIGETYSSAATYNRLVIGAGGVVTNVGTLYVGRGGRYTSGWPSFNQLVVSDGGKLFANGSIRVGTITPSGNDNCNATNNTALIANGSVVRANGEIYVGALAPGYANGNGTYSFNSLTITNGGQLYSGSAASYIGRVASSYVNGKANGNTVTIAGSLNGTNAMWNLGGQPLYVGFTTNGPAIGNVLTVGAGGVATNISCLTVSGTNTLSVGAGGLVYANAVTNSGTMTVGIDSMVTPDCGCLVVAGNLNLSNTTLNIVTNSKPVSAAYVIASYGSLTGGFAATNGMPSLYIVNMNYKSLNQIALTAPPPGLTITLR